MDTQPSHACQHRYPPLQSHAHGWLEVGDGHQIYWEESGNPAAPAALFVHGGPGAGCTPHDRRWFDPSRWRIVLFDQRGAGRSRPLGRLVANRTDALVSDMELLRQHLRLNSWLLFGGSWGATLALAYAQQHPSRVQALVLRGIFTATASEQRWLYSAQGAAQQQPTDWQRLTATLPTLAQTHLPWAMAARLHGGDAGAENAAAQAWLQWEQDLMRHEMPSVKPGPQRTVDDAGLAMARIGVHFACHAFFLAEGQLLARAARLHAVPGTLVQGELDRVTPPHAALALHRAWRGSQLLRAESAGHASSHPALAALLIQATDHFSVPAVRPWAPPAHTAATLSDPPPPSWSAHGKDQFQR